MKKSPARPDKETEQKKTRRADRSALPAFKGKGEVQIISSSTRTVFSIPSAASLMRPASM